MQLMYGVHMTPELTQQPGPNTDGSPARRPLTQSGSKADSAVVAVIGLLGVLGFINSFVRVNEAAGASCGKLAWMVPLTVDVGIAAFSLFEIWLAKRNMQRRVVKVIPWGLTIATICMNVAPEFGHKSLSLVGIIAHAVLPGLWVVAVDVGSHVLRVQAGMIAGTRMDRIRRSRWVLAPFTTMSLWRRMILWEIHSYPEALRRERSRVLAVADMKERYGRNWKRVATPRELALYQIGELTPQAVCEFAEADDSVEQGAADSDDVTTGDSGGTVTRFRRRTTRRARRGTTGVTRVPFEARLKEARERWPVGTDIPGRPTVKAEMGLTSSRTAQEVIAALKAERETDTDDAQEA
jgi:hypothetical protein